MYCNYLFTSYLQLLFPPRELKSSEGRDQSFGVDTLKPLAEGLNKCLLKKREKS